MSDTNTNDAAARPNAGEAQSVDDALVTVQQAAETLDDEGLVSLPPRVVAAHRVLSDWVADAERRLRMIREARERLRRSSSRADLMAFLRDIADALDGTDAGGGTGAAT